MNNGLPYGVRSILAAVCVMLPAIAGCRSVDGTLAGVGARETGPVRSSMTVQPTQNIAPAARPAGGQQTAPQALVQPGEPADAKRQAVEEIRAKAATSVASGAQPQVGPVPVSAASPMSPQEQEALKRELAAEALAAQGEISDEELLAEQESIRRLRAKAGSHYNQALKKIEN
jgi:hypothetical protein